METAPCTVETGMQAGNLSEMVAEAALRLAKAPPSGQAGQSIEHCEAQCNLWRLKTAQAATIGDDRALRTASENAAMWEQRRGQAIRHKKADDLAECRRILEEMTSAAVGFGSLDA